MRPGLDRQRQPGSHGSYQAGARKLLTPFTNTNFLLVEDRFYIYTTCFLIRLIREERKKGNDVKFSHINGPEAKPEENVQEHEQ